MMNKVTLVEHLTQFLQDHQLETPEDARNIAGEFAGAMDAKGLLEDPNTYGDLNWTPTDIIDRAGNDYDIEVTREQAIEMFESEPLWFMKHVSSMEYGWQMIDDAIFDRFRDAIEAAA
jgi:hypothetical protein